jgi:hypothetical protein
LPLNQGRILLFLTGINSTILRLSSLLRRGEAACVSQRRRCEGEDGQIRVALRTPDAARSQEKRSERQQTRRRRVLQYFRTGREGRV